MLLYFKSLTNITFEVEFPDSAYGKLANFFAKFSKSLVFISVKPISNPQEPFFYQLRAMFGGVGKKLEVFSWWCSLGAGQSTIL